ncbi:MAG: cytochrome c maturation protein CcmE [Coriobacteriia bacterium]|nr:cytochrome c maturation protein CcmE [Coriobacteriia bacterium]
MNAKMKKRMVAVCGVIAIVAIVLFAVVGGSSAATVASVGDAAAGTFEGKKVQVTGTVVDNSFSVDKDGVLTFDVVDPEGDPAQTVRVVYDKGVSATFGNGVSAICTGRMNGNVLECTELVTKCPSKYESASSALGVDQFLGYGESVLGKTVKVTGLLVDDPADATQKVRFELVDAEAGDGAKAKTLQVAFTGALPEDVAKGVQVVIQGASDESGLFTATSVSLEG